VVKGKIVIYCDGGARPNPGKTGYGVHMYMAIEHKKPVAILSKYAVTNNGYINKVNIKTDNLINNELRLLHLFPEDNNENKMIIPMMLNKVVELYGHRDNSFTNNTAELDAIIMALDKLSLLESDDIECSELTILTDSTYVLGFIKKILTDRLDLLDVNVNLEHLEELRELINVVGKAYKINIGKVPAHEDNLGNNKADMLATLGVMLNRNNKTDTVIQHVMVDTKDYWKVPNLNLDKLFFKQVFNFYPDTSLTDNVIYGINYKDPSDIGKKITNITYTVCKLNEQPTILFDIIKIIRSKLDNTFYPYLIFLDILTNKNLLRDYLRYGKDFLIVSGDEFTVIKTITGLVLAKVMYPAGLSSIVMDKCLQLDTVLREYQTDKLMPNVETFDITDLIYTKNSKSKVIIKPDIINDKYIVKVPYRHKNPNIRALTIRVRTKLDLPNRNTMKRFETLNPKVILMVTVYDKLVEYKTLVILNNEDYILSSNIYSNKIILKEKK